MKKILVIGSTVTDVIIHLNHLPQTEEDINTSSQTLSLGGCAYNVSDMLRHFNVPYSLFSPIGAGLYGDFIKETLAKKGVCSIIPPIQEENGCCYCLVEDNGKRSFISVRGAEYQFKREWFDALNINDYDMAYVCGLELEEASGELIINFLLEHPQLQIFFAPGPRLTSINAERMQKLFSLHPILHLNKEEAFSYTGTKTINDALTALNKLTQNMVIITDAANGAYAYKEDKIIEVPAFPAKQRDTIGAGDAHIGTIMAVLKKGLSIMQALVTANHISACVVENEGSLLSDEAFHAFTQGAFYRQPTAF